MKTVFQCDHCSHVSSMEPDIEIHEAKCSHNPACRACDSCEHAYEEGGVFGSYLACKKNIQISMAGFNSNCEQWEALAPSEDELRRRREELEALKANKSLGRRSAETVAEFGIFNEDVLRDIESLIDQQ